MENEGRFELHLLTSDRRPAQEQRATVRFYRNGNTSNAFAEATNLAFPPERSFNLPAFPQAHSLVAHVNPSRYKARWSDFFTLMNEQTQRQELMLFRQPSRWQARFTTWRSLSGQFERLQRVLAASPNLRVRNAGVIERFVEDDYDEAGDALQLPKTALLNLYGALLAIKEPVNQRPWFSFTQRLFLIDRERFVAQVDAPLGELVRRIHDHPGDFPDYRASSGSSHARNFTAAVPSGYRVNTSAIVSVKTGLAQGNVQLTVAPSFDAQNRPITLLDADIDENRALLKHLADVFKHLFTGGTHPYEIHDFLRLFNSELELGYQLV